MTRTMFVDDYGCVDLYYLVHASKVDPSDEHPEDHEWLIGCLLHVANQALPCSLSYPTRGHRDAAFEAMTVLLRQVQTQNALEDEEA